MRKSFHLLFILMLLAGVYVQPVAAQTSGPVYIVQPGDTLSAIANRFNLTLNELLAANPGVDPNLLAQGQQLVIPGLEGVTGILDTEIIAFGDSFRSLVRRTQVSAEQLMKMNRLVSPSELYVGINLIIPRQEGQQELSTRINIGTGESLLELAVKQNTDVWSLTELNKSRGTWDALPGDVLYSPAEGGGTATGLPSAFLSATITPLPMVQGGTQVIRVQTKDNLPVTGLLVDHPLHFSASASDQFALQGIHALQEPGVYPLRLQIILPDGSIQLFEQMVLVLNGNYLNDPILFVDPVTIDPAVTEPENQNIIAITSPFTPIQYWSDFFTSPSVNPDCFNSRYGNRRTYKVINSDSEVTGFHTGLDFCGGEGLQIFAPAPGKVVFAAPLTVRGNATIIDHGLGVYSGFWHQSQILVNVGDLVTQGQVVGLVGGTGRVTGAHLHWEVWVNGVQVEPLDWLEQAYP